MDERLEILNVTWKGCTIRNSQRLGGSDEVLEILKARRKG